MAELEAAQEAQDKAEAAAQGDQGAVMPACLPPHAGPERRTSEMDGLHEASTAMLADARCRWCLLRLVQLPVALHHLPFCCPSHPCAQEGVAAVWAAC